MSNIYDDKNYITTGTTEPIHIPRTDSKTVSLGNVYFVVKLASAQAAFTGSVWQRVKQLVVTSQVDLNLQGHPTLGDPLQAIQHARRVNKGRAEKLGISPNLINLIPAMVSHIMISIEFVLDTKNSLAMLAGLINNKAFLSAISLAPGAAMAARTISGISQQIIQTFMEPEERKPILQFRGDLNIATDELKEGYYVILGTQDKQYPIPRPLPTLTICDGDLLADGQPVTQWSYVILEVRCIDARTRDLSNNAEWELRLREAETEAQNIAYDPLVDDQQRQHAWEKCKTLFQEAQILLRADPNYLRREADEIIKTAYHRCYRDIYSPGTDYSELSVRGSKSPQVSDRDQEGRRLLGISSEEDLTSVANYYTNRVSEARHFFEQMEIA